MACTCTCCTLASIFALAVTQWKPWLLLYVVVLWSLSALCNCWRFAIAEHFYSMQEIAALLSIVA